MSNKSNQTLTGVWDDINLSEEIGVHTFNLDDIQDEQGIHLQVLPELNEAQFRLEDVLGQGGMGVVYSAYDTVLNRKVALKALLNDAKPHSALWKRFYREAQITAQLSHPSIVPIYGLQFDEQQQPTLIMKKINGITLQDFMFSCMHSEDQENYEEQYGLLSRLDILIKICDAMFYAHNKGVIHRDLKPDNVMVGAFEDIYVMDWGIARTLDSADFTAEETANIELADLGIQTQMGLTIGTARYMSPEQARGDALSISFASDQYSLGLMLYEMATLQPARPAQNVSKMIENAKVGIWNSQQFAEDTAHLDPRLIAIIQKATAPEVDERYSTVKDLARDLRAFTRNQSVSVLKENWLRKLARYLQSNPLLVVVIFAGLLSFLALQSSYSFYKALQAENQAKLEEKIGFELLHAVSSQTRAVDRSFSQVQSEVAELATITRLRSEDIAQAPNNCLMYSDLQQSKYAIVAESYGMDNFVSFERSVCQTPTGKTLEESQMGLSIASLVEPEMRSLFRAVDPESFDQHIGTLENRYLLQWIYIGFEDGALLNYPGVHQFGEGYDARKRPWYVTGQYYDEPKCGEPYPDASGTGYLLPCNQRIVNSDGQLLGVAGIDLFLDALIDEISLEKMPFASIGYLVNEKGEILFASTEKGEKVETLKSSDNNKSKEKQEFQNARLLSEIRNHKVQGMIRGQHSTMVYSRLQFVPWYLIYSFEPAIWTCTDCIE